MAVSKVTNEEEFDTAVGKFNIMVLAMDSGVAELALDCIIWQDNKIHELKEQLELYESSS